MQRRTGFALTLGLAVLAGLSVSHKPRPAPGYIATFDLGGDDPWYGGLSAIDLSVDGLQGLAVSDRTRLVELSLQRDAAGQIIGVTHGPLQPLQDVTGAVLTGVLGDSEGIDLAPDGTLLLSFEGEPARVMRRAPGDSGLANLPIPKAFLALEFNGGFEAVASDRQGRIYAIPERAVTRGDPVQVFRLTGDSWDSALTLPRRGILLPVGADFGPDGRLYLLERAFDVFAGFSTRVRRFDLQGDRVVHETTVIETAPGVHDNLEGISVWRDGAGRLRATLIADDNFQALLGNELVEYRLPD